MNNQQQTDAEILKEMGAFTMAPVAPMDTEWGIRHNTALMAPNGEGENLIVGLMTQIHAHAIHYEGDYLHTPEVLVPLINAARAFLNWDIGRIDAGTIDSYLCDVAQAAGWNLDTDAWL